MDPEMINVDLPMLVESTDASDPEFAKQSNTAMIIGVAGTLHAIALVASILRIYARLLVVKRFRLEDYFIVMSTLCGFICMIILIIQAYHGLGKHQSILLPAQEVMMGKLNFALTITGLVSIWFLKTSIALALLSLISASSRWTGRLLWALIVFFAAYTILALATNIFHCRPISGTWNYYIKSSCYSTSMYVGFALSNSAFSMFSDVALAVIPVPIIWKLKMALKVRLYLIGILSMGYFAVAMCAVKTYFQFNYTLITDSTFDDSIQFFFLLELNIGLIAACAPSLKPLFNKALGLTTRSYKSSNLYGDRPTLGADGSKLRRGYMMQNSVDAGEDFELGNVSRIQGGRAVRTRGESIYDKEHEDGASSQDFIIPSGKRSPTGGIQVTRVTQVSISH